MGYTVFKQELFLQSPPQPGLQFLPLPPRGPLNWLQTWPTASLLFSGRRAASSCAHHTSETSPVLHETVSPHPPVKAQAAWSTWTLAITDGGTASGGSSETYPFENVIFVIAPFHEEDYFPACIAIHRVDLKEELNPLAPLSLLKELPRLLPCFLDLFQQNAAVLLPYSREGKSFLDLLLNK